MELENRSLRKAIYSKFETQSECAKKLGWDRQKLSYIVNGQRMPSLEDTSQLARVLEISVDALTQKILLQKSHKCDEQA